MQLIEVQDFGQKITSRKRKIDKNMKNLYELPKPKRKRKLKLEENSLTPRRKYLKKVLTGGKTTEMHLTEIQTARTRLRPCITKRQELERARTPTQDIPEPQVTSTDGVRASTRLTIETLQQTQHQKFKQNLRENEQPIRSVFTKNPKVKSLVTKFSEQEQKPDWTESGAVRTGNQWGDKTQEGGLKLQHKPPTD